MLNFQKRKQETVIRPWTNICVMIASHLHLREKVGFTPDLFKSQLLNKKLR